MAPHQRQRDDSQRTEQGANRETLADIADDFMGVDQIIHRDEVEAHAEFVPEKPFRHHPETQGKQADARNSQHQSATGAAGRLARTERAFQQHQGRQGQPQGDEIEYQPGTQHFGSRGGGHLCGMPGLAHQYQAYPGVQE